MNLLARNIVYLVSCKINNSEPDMDVIQEMDIQKLLSYAGRHMMKAITAAAWEAFVGRSTETTGIIASAIRKAVLFDNAWLSIQEKLENEGVWYMPLKGAVLKDYYPGIGLREMADYDILIDGSRTKDVKDIMEGLGFTAQHFGGGKDDAYYKDPVLNFEMHNTLMDYDFEQQCKYYEDVKTRLIKDENNDFGYHFSPEDFYLFMIAHHYKHYNNGGAGIRSLLDTYIFLKKEKLDMTYVKEEAIKLGVAEFEEANRTLAFHLFSGEELTAAEQDALDYITSSGAFGTIDHLVQNRVDRKDGNKAGYIKDRLSVPFSRNNIRYKSFAAEYPVFYKYKVLLPFLPFYRVVRSMRTGRFKGEAKALLKAKKGRRE